MPSTSVAVQMDNSPSAAVPSIPDKKPAITRKVREAINAMVWLGLPRAEAAKKAGLSDHGLYKAFRSPPVKAAYLAECEMLRLSGKARRIHRLNDMVEQNENKAAVINAAVALEHMGDDNPLSANGNPRSPGVVIQIINSVGPIQHGTDD